MQKFEPFDPSQLNYNINFFKISSKYYIIITQVSNYVKVGYVEFGVMHMKILRVQFFKTKLECIKSGLKWALV